MKTIGFIGAGNMGSAIISGILKNDFFKSADICVHDRIINGSISKLNIIVTTLQDLVVKSDYIILCIKPKNIFEITEEIKKIPNYDKKIYISIAAGIKLSALKNALGNVKIIRAMPNLALKVGAGMTVITRCELVSDEEFDFGESIFSAVGKTLRIDESYIDACTAINGSGPAYVFMFIEALADAAVKNGIDRSSAYLLASQTVYGSAAMQLKTELHPGVLKDMVCSPAGTTIDAVAALEKNAFRSTVMEAVDACTKKAVQMGKKAE